MKKGEIILIAIGLGILIFPKPIDFICVLAFVLYFAYDLRNKSKGICEIKHKFPEEPSEY